MFISFVTFLFEMMGICPILFTITLRFLELLTVCFFTFVWFSKLLKLFQDMRKLQSVTFGNRTYFHSFMASACMEESHLLRRRYYKHKHPASVRYTDNFSCRNNEILLNEFNTYFYFNLNFAST